MNFQLNWTRPFNVSSFPAAPQLYLIEMGIDWWHNYTRIVYAVLPSRTRDLFHFSVLFQAMQYEDGVILYDFTLDPEGTYMVAMGPRPDNHDYDGVPPTVLAVRTSCHLQLDSFSI